MSEFDGRKANEEVAPVVKNYEGIGELVVGGGNATHVIVTALCLLNNPLINQYLLDNKLKLVDRLTKTKIFPREGMALPDGEVFTPPAENVIEESK